MRRSRHQSNAPTVEPLVDPSVIVRASGVRKTYDTGQVRVEALETAS